MGVLMLRPLMLRGEFGLYGAVKSCGAGNLLLINVSYLLEEASLKEMVSSRLLPQCTIIHQVGHAAESLLTFEYAYYLYLGE